MQKTNAAEQKDVVVIGAGIVGLACAEHLVNSGRKVLLIEKDKPAMAASYGNAGAFAYSDILPLASPGVIKKAIKWLLDPLGPFSVVPADLPWTLPWLVRFLIASRPSQFKRSIAAQAAMMVLSRTSMQEMLRRCHMDHMVHSGGSLHLYEKESEFRSDQINWKMRQDYGISFDTLHGDGLHEFQKDLSPQFTSGVFVPGWQTVSNPYKFGIALYDELRSKGAEMLVGAVKTIGEDPCGVRVELVDGQKIYAKQIIVSAGPWSTEMAKQMGDKIPLVAERGYNTTLPSSALNLERQLIFGEHGFVMTPLIDGVRVGGASEIARLGRAANYNRSSVMLEKAKQFIPSLDISNGEQWLGARPSIPDTLPVIGHSKKSENVIYAFGHGHLGLTQSSATGAIIANMANKLKPPIDVSAFSPKRF